MNYITESRESLSTSVRSNSNTQSKIVLVLGASGSGKSSFIKHLADNPQEIIVGESLDPATKSVSEHLATHNDEKVILLDTPGMDYPRDISSQVANCTRLLGRKEKPYAIIFLHNIQHPRHGMQASMETIYLRRQFGEMLGIAVDTSFPFYRVVFVTTMWTDETNVEEHDEQARRERELVVHFGLLEQQGMRFRRYYNTKESAMEVLTAVLMAEMPDEKIISLRGRLTIAVIGVSASGKSSFVSAVTGDNSIMEETGTPVDDVTAHEVQVNGENVILLDTPGLDYKDDREAVFKQLAVWLKAQAKRIRQGRIYLDGIVVVHPILQDIRPKPIIRQSFLVDHANMLLGLKRIYDKKDENAYRRVVLATTMWDKHGGERQRGVEQEKSMCNNDWNIMHTAGASMMRFENTSESGMQILKKIVDERKDNDPKYQFRKIGKGIEDLKDHLQSLQQDLDGIRREQSELRRGQEALRQLSGWDNVVARLFD